ncbi:kinase-like protein [Hypoxylon sp. EC38]|nr:kinase-like protein [Hypoxylon sp. EC38]
MVRTRSSLQHESTVIGPRDKIWLDIGYWRISSRHYELIDLRCVPSITVRLVTSADGNSTPSSSTEKQPELRAQLTSRAQELVLSSSALYRVTEIPMHTKVAIGYRDAQTSEDVTESILTIHRKMDDVPGNACLYIVNLEQLPEGKSWQHIVLKNLKPEGVDPDDLDAIFKRAQGFEREVGHHKDLVHPKIVPFIHSDSRMMAIFIGLVPGSHLGTTDRMASESFRANFNSGEVFRILLDISSALNYMHNKNKLLHNDIKPSNIMCSDKHGATLIDMGMACEIGKQAEHNIWSDIWAFGVTMLYVLGAIDTPGAGHKRWSPADLRDERDRDKYTKARQSAKGWLGSLRETIDGIKSRDYRIRKGKKDENPELHRALLHLTIQMLSPNPEDRPDMCMVEERVKLIGAQHSQPIVPKVIKDA